QLERPLLHRDLIPRLHRAPVLVGGRDQLVGDLRLRLVADHQHLGLGGEQPRLVLQIRTVAQQRLRERKPEAGADAGVEGAEQAVARVPVAAEGDPTCCPVASVWLKFRLVFCPSCESVDAPLVCEVCGATLRVLLKLAVKLGSKGLRAPRTAACALSIERRRSCTWVSLASTSPRNSLSVRCSSPAWMRWSSPCTGSTLGGVKWKRGACAAAVAAASASAAPASNLLVAEGFDGINARS